jgi:hypothetical protein
VKASDDDLRKNRVEIAQLVADAHPLSQIGGALGATGDRCGARQAQERVAQMHFLYSRASRRSRSKRQAAMAVVHSMRAPEIVEVKARGVKKKENRCLHLPQRPC